MQQDDEHEQDSAGERCYGKDIDRPQRGRVIRQEGSPCLGRRAARPQNQSTGWREYALSGFIPMHPARQPNLPPAVRWTEIFEGIEPDAFEELAHLAGKVSEAPIAMVTLVDEDRRWFTSLIGAQLAAVFQTNVFVVPDAYAIPDSRATRWSRSHPMCASTPGLR